MPDGPPGSVASCPLCGAPSAHLLTTRDRNRGIGHEAFHYRRCHACRTVFLANPPANLGDYYPDDYYPLTDRAELRRESTSESYKLELVRRHVRGGRMVEIGPGNGAFADLATRSGFDYAGVEMDARACAHLRDELGLSMVHSDRPDRALAELPPSDAIVLWHVLEHLPDPWAFVAAAAGNLAPGGLLACSLPNPQSLQFRILRSRWPHVDAPRHLYLIPLDTLVGRARRSGLALRGATSSDPGGNYWNLFGWRQFFAGAAPGRLGTLLALTLGTGLTVLLAPLERRHMRGATYTALFVKEGAA